MSESCLKGFFDYRWTLTADMARDYGKPGMNTSDFNVAHQLEAPTVRSAWVQQSGQQFLIEVSFTDELHTMYGAPATAWINYTVGSTATKTVALEVSLLNKTATRCASRNKVFSAFECNCIH